MTRDLHEKIGSVTPENLFAGLEPKALHGAGVIEKLTTAATLVRGTLLGKKNGKLSVYGGGTGVSPDCVLAEDVAVGTSDDENALVYLSGNFNEDALTLAADYTLTEADKDTLRTKGIYIGASETERVTA